MKNRNLLNQLLIVLVSALLFVPFIGNLHLFDWDEINFAESAREMILSRDYLSVQINFEPFWEKPPLFIWLEVLSMKIFGINEFAARFPNAFCGIATLLVIYNLGRKLNNNLFGFLWVIAYAGSVLPFLYFKSGIIDPWFNLFIFLSIYFWVSSLESKPGKTQLLNSSISAAFLGLSILTKGPVSIIIFGMVVMVLFFIKRFRLGINLKSIALFLAVLCFVGGFWFILQIILGNSKVVADFIVYQIRLFQTKDAGHGGFPFYHFVVLLLGVFPASIFAIQGHKYTDSKNHQKVFHTSMVILLWVVLLLFSIVKTKIVHYSSLAYFPITYLAAYSMFKIQQGGFHFRIWQKISIALIGTIMAGLIIMLPALMANKQLFIDKGIISHPFTIGNLQANPGWGFGHSSIASLLIVGIVVSFYFISKNKKVGFTVLYVSSALFIYFTILFVAPGAEKISQRAVVEFVKETSKKDVYFYFFYKSFIPLYYGKTEIPANKNIFDVNWLATGDIDKDAYFVCRINNRAEIIEQYPLLEVMHEKNGYVFFKRSKK